MERRACRLSWALGLVTCSCRHLETLNLESLELFNKSLTCEREHKLYWLELIRIAICVGTVSA
jgi:hypothetical protein